MQKTAYELRISDWSSDVCSSDLILLAFVTGIEAVAHRRLFSRAIDPLAGAESAATKVDLRYLQHTLEQQIGRASCRERVCQYVSISVVALSLTKKALYRTQHIIYGSRTTKNV